MLPDSVAWQDWVPALTVTVPVGAGSTLPVNSPATCTAAVTGWPTTGLEVVEVIEVDEGAWPTVTVTGEEVWLESKLASPG